MGRCCFWMLIALLSFAWFLNVTDFFIGIPQGEGYIWRDLHTFSLPYLMLRELSDVAVRWRVISVPLFVALYAANIWLVISMWRKRKPDERVIRKRLYAATPGLLVNGVYLAIVIQAVRMAASNLTC